LSHPQPPGQAHQPLRAVQAAAQALKSPALARFFWLKARCGRATIGVTQYVRSGVFYTAEPNVF